MTETTEEKQQEGSAVMVALLSNKWADLHVTSPNEYVLLESNHLVAPGVQ
jgi:hypothetical protein